MRTAIRAALLPLRLPSARPPGGTDLELKPPLATARQDAAHHTEFGLCLQRTPGGRWQEVHLIPHVTSSIFGDQHSKFVTAKSNILSFFERYACWSTCRL